jgi:hypothetical protein
VCVYDGSRKRERKIQLSAGHLVKAITIQILIDQLLYTIIYSTYVCCKYICILRMPVIKASLQRILKNVEATVTPFHSYTDRLESAQCRQECDAVQCSAAAYRKK